MPLQPSSLAQKVVDEEVEGAGGGGNSAGGVEQAPIQPQVHSHTTPQQLHKTG